MTIDMATAIKADSLSSITDIAANPPLDPSASSRLHTQPLILYIARVPGSRDVFLTPLKPRAKVVTAEDVQSSLYYVHISDSEDAGSQDALDESISSGLHTSVLPVIGRNDIQRKPTLPTRRPVTTSLDTNLVENDRPGFSGPSSSPKPSHIARKPVFADITNVPTSYQPMPVLPVLPPRPLPSLPSEAPVSAPGAIPAFQRQPYRQHGPVMREEHLNDHEGHPSDMLPAATGLASSLTLIRRDPATSNQWNVATISDPPVDEVSSASQLGRSNAGGGRVKKGGAPLYLDITNAAYLAFAAQSNSGGRTSTSSDSTQEDPPSEGVFRRRLFMPGSKYADHSYSNRATSSRNSIAVFNGEMLARTLRNRDVSDTGSSSLPHMDRRTQGYGFKSPWDGLCEFSTSVSGRSLKCRHKLPNEQGTDEVSELRFNLPNDSHLTPTIAHPQQKRRSYFDAMHRRMRSDDSWGGGPSPGILADGMAAFNQSKVSDYDRMDLSLGQEWAGGGFGGKQAKLGKLIVYPEGVGMLDLLVAANIGLWWRAWAKVG